MTLVDLRKLAIRKGSKIRFGLKNGMQCIIAEDGVARVPELKAVPGFNLEEELSAATEFVVEAVVPAGTKNQAKPKPVSMSRAEISALTHHTPSAIAVHDEHEDE